MDEHPVRLKIYTRREWFLSYSPSGQVQHAAEQYNVLEGLPIQVELLLWLGKFWIISFYFGVFVETKESPGFSPVYYQLDERHCPIAQFLFFSFFFFTSYYYRYCYAVLCFYVPLFTNYHYCVQYLEKNALHFWWNHNTIFKDMQEMAVNVVISKIFWGHCYFDCSLTILRPEVAHLI